ncbi:Emopamil-binding protein [Aureobasidium sp. EXF-8845]|nr:Emopamil-binding protein [Aureobasidium sp. EXF-8845]KAI4794521.1 Emopamil-binding protein [Aureobasidium sp. EXF-8846]
MASPFQVLMNDTMSYDSARHPYYPLDVSIVGYLANESTVLSLLGSFVAGCATIFGSTYLAVKRMNSGLPATELITVMWFVLCGCIHLFFEGYFAYNHGNMAGLQTVFGQLWKEYALSDSRYITQDMFVFCVEAMTAVLWGPLSFVVALLIVSEHPLRHPLQAAVSLGQCYGDLLYYATSMADHFYLGIEYSRPEAYYFWGYYFGANFLWIVIPAVLLYNSVKASANAIRQVQELKSEKKTT